MKKMCWICLLLFLLMSCNLTKKNEIERLVKDWIGKEITLISTCDASKKELRHTHTIISYIDSLGCISCKLQLNKWDVFQRVVDSLADIRIVFVVHPSVKKEIGYLFKSYHYSPDLCLMDSGSIWARNISLFTKNELQTFLLDKDNKIVAIGNPIHNPKIKELYLKIIQGKSIGEEKTTVQTQVAVPETSFTFGNFDWQEAQTHSFEVKNVGHELLVIQDVTTSCGCITVDFPKEPVQPGGTAMVKVTYKADQQEYFNKTVTIYGNAEQLPLALHVSGNARRLTIDN